MMMIPYNHSQIKIGVMKMSEISVQTAYEMFIQQGSPSWSSRTKFYYENNLRYFFSFLADRFGRSCDQISVSELSKTVLYDYVIFLRGKDKYVGHPLRSCMTVNGSIKSNTVITYVRAVKAFCNFLYKQHIVTDRLAEGLRLPKSDSDQIVPLMAEEVYKIDSIFDRESPNDLRNLCIVHLMLDAGLRSSEVCSLRTEDILFSSNTIVINRSKGDKSRIVIMSPPLKSLLEEYFFLCKPSVVAFRKKSDNQPITPAVMCSLFQRIIRNTGIDRIHPHLLRHTFATSYIIGGGDLESLRILMGHSDYSVTRIYLHLAAQYRIIGADIYRLDPIFFKSGY